MEQTPTVSLLNKIASEVLPDNLCDMGEPVVLEGDLNLQVMPKGQDAFLLNAPTILKLEASLSSLAANEEQPGIIRVIVPYYIAYRLLNLQKNFYVNYFLALCNKVLVKVSKQYDLQRVSITAKRPGALGDEGYFRELESTAGYEIRFFIKPQSIKEIDKCEVL